MRYTIFEHQTDFGYYKVSTPYEKVAINPSWDDDVVFVVLPKDATFYRVYINFWCEDKTASASLRYDNDDLHQVFPSQSKHLLVPYPESFPQSLDQVKAFVGAIEPVLRSTINTILGEHEEELNRMANIVKAAKGG